MPATNPMIEQLKQAHDIDTRYSHARQQLLFSTINLRGYANKTTGRVAPSRVSWFQAKENTVGQGFDTPLHHGLTNFSGSPSTMPANQLYVALAAGVRFVTRPSLITPRGVLQEMTGGKCSIDVRRGDSTAYCLGALEHLPCGRFGYSSRSVAAIGNPPVNGDMSLVDFPQNGDAGLKMFPAGSELVFKQGGLIEVILNIHEEFYLTDDGLAANNPADIRDCLVQFVFDGYTLSSVDG